MNLSETTVEQLEYDLFQQNGIPVSIYLSILCIVGIIGNGHALLIYTFRFKPTNCRVFVQWLSSVDLAVCTLCIPFEFVIIRKNLTFLDDVACKVFRFFTHALVISSGVMLAVIAIHRRRKLGNPNGKQFSLKKAHIACFSILLIMGVISIPSVFFFQVEPILGIEGHRCALDNHVITLPYFQIWIGFLTSLVNIVYVICIAAYAFVLKVIISQLRCKTSKAKTIEKTVTSTVHSKNIKSMKTWKKTPVSGKTSSAFDTLKHSKQITVLFIAASTVSYLGYMAYIISIWLDITNTDINNSLSAVSAIFYRGFFLSSAANPVVYLFLERKFRQECKILYAKLFALCKINCKSEEI